MNLWTFNCSVVGWGWRISAADSSTEFGAQPERGSYWLIVDVHISMAIIHTRSERAFYALSLISGWAARILNGANLKVHNMVCTVNDIRTYMLTVNISQSGN